MRFVTPVALALVLAVTGGAVSTPAFAAKKEKKAKSDGAPKLNVSPEVIKPLQAAQEAMNKQDIEGAKALIAQAEALSKSNDDRYQTAAIKLNLSITAKDAEMQAQALRTMLDSGLTPADQVGQYSAVAADAELAAKNYDAAISRAQAAVQAGYKPEMANVTLAQAYFGKAGTGNATAEPARTNTVNGLAALKAGADATKASGQPVPAQWYQIGVQRAAAANLPEVGEWAKLAYAAQPNGENLRTLIRVFQRSHPNISNRENLDVLRLMAVSDGLVVAGDFTEYAETAWKTGIYGEVKAAIDAGRSKGVLTGNQGGDFYQQAVPRIEGDKASLGSAEADSRKAANGRIALATADAYLGYGNYAKATELFEVAKQKGGVDTDEINSRIGIAKALAGDTVGAKAAFESVQAGARKEIAGLWLTYLASKGA
ncbi:MAG: hypothetical protein AB7E60_09435 [Sphingobium sp.]